MLATQAIKKNPGASQEREGARKEKQIKKGREGSLRTKKKKKRNRYKRNNEKKKKLRQAENKNLAVETVAIQSQHTHTHTQKKILLYNDGNNSNDGERSECCRAVIGR